MRLSLPPDQQDSQKGLEDAHSDGFRLKPGRPEGVVDGPSIGTGRRSTRRLDLPQLAGRASLGSEADMMAGWRTVSRLPTWSSNAAVG